MMHQGEAIPTAIAGVALGPFGLFDCFRLAGALRCWPWTLEDELAGNTAEKLAALALGSNTWFVSLLDNGAWIGAGYFTNIAPGKSAWLHACSKPGTHPAKALAALKTGIGRAFRQFNLARVGASTCAENAFAIRANARLGFQKEGVMRASKWYGGQPYDAVIMSILRQNWEH